MPALSEYSNVHSSVFNIIINKGYALWHNKENETYCAEKNGWDFIADSPCSLLGLISIFEYKNPESYQEYWWKEEKEDFKSEKDLNNHPPDYISVVYKKT